MHPECTWSTLLLLNAACGQISIFISRNVKQLNCRKLAASSAPYHFNPNCGVDIKSSCKANISCLTAD
ncbi:hypothetical protein T05_12505 [Trichinella murrelli]|uniref:Uncharacterized protein n=1 Tax=Trichinella murrelli TaxID=144512 RepID=A0A0V0TPT5_9BILA|nr:hypothetical protein T05_12505 [Trichinella murrelli]